MLIGLVGFAGSGKGTVADFLITEKNYTKLSFADPVKDCISIIFGWDRDLLEGDTDESREFREKVDTWWSNKLEKEITPRKMLQIMGTEAGRNSIHKNIWIHVLEKNLEKYDNVVISDVRFTNEMFFIREMHGFNVRVKRGKEPEWFDIAREANQKNTPENMKNFNVHYSEWAWIGHPYDYELSNDASLETLQVNIENMLKVLKEPANIVPSL